MFMNVLVNISKLQSRPIPSIPLSMPKSPTAKRLACVPCTRSKRKCTKEAPSCIRCLDKNLSCHYPAPRVAPPFNLVYAEDGEISAIIAQESEQLTDGLEPRTKISDPASSGLPQSTNPCSTDSVQLNAVDSLWFLTRESWNIDHKDAVLAEMYFSDTSLTYFTDQLETWLGQWIKEGCCPFIHEHLYDVELPDCVQDAYTTLAAYLSKTRENKTLVMHIFERRLNHLVEEQAVLDGNLEPRAFDIFGQLARTQALLVYEIIGLFDGSIRGRALAERHIGLLSQWARQLWEQAKQSLHTEATGSSSHNYNGQNTTRAGIIETENPTAIWRTWILVESVRRTYLMATLTEAAFVTLKQGWAPCPGGITFTCGNGLWPSKSANDWVTRSKQQRILYLKCIDGEELFAEASAADIDEFTRIVLIASFGLERFKQWEDRT